MEKYLDSILIVYSKDSLIFLDISNFEILYRHICNFSISSNNKDGKCNFKINDDDTIIISDEKCLFKVIKFYNEYNILGFRV